MSTYRLKKSCTILQNVYDWYKNRSSQLSPDKKAELEQRMLALEGSVHTGNREEASRQAQALEAFSKEYCKKTSYDYIKELLVALLIAFILAVVVRQMWFEPYEIPTGSMRPTFKEQDRITVSKTAFGLNIPLTTGHFLFEPSHVERTSAITFTSEGIKNLDEDSLFLGLFPYKKRLIKRTIGKPGDALYFYGGKIYGVDKNGKALEELIQAPWMANLEHIPFLKFSGKKSLKEKKSFFSQMNIPIGRIYVNRGQQVGEIYDGQNWIKDDPAAQSSTHSHLKAYSDFFGMRNFATARLLSKKELTRLYPNESLKLEKAPLYLELKHHPSLTYPKPSIDILHGKSNITLNPLKSIVPLQQRHLDAIMDGMYTARLVFKDERGTRYSTEAPSFSQASPLFPGVPDGTYEFYHGTLYEIGSGAIAYTASQKHPLYSHSAQNVQKLFNLGIEMHLGYQSAPSRYAYFRDGDLYLMGHPVIKKDDPTLIAFNEQEASKEKNASADKPYTAFKDFGPPLKDGKYDVEFIRTFGVKVPEKKYLLLGDNHAMSADSRVFGFIPEENLQGAPSLILWPPGQRWGIPEQKPYPLFSASRILVWSLAAAAFSIWSFRQRRRRQRPIVLNMHKQMV